MKYLEHIPEIKHAEAIRRKMKVDSLIDEVQEQFFSSEITLEEASDKICEIQKIFKKWIESVTKKQ